MTNQEAIVHIKDVICENNAIKPNIVVFEQEKEALYMAIKALENQKSVIEELEKIKAELHKLAFDDDDGDYLTLIDDDEAMELIDKYISELKGEQNG